MSEKEKLQRYLYQKRRKTLMILQSVIIVLVSLALLFTGFTYLKMNKDTYVSYTESGKVIYKAYLADNKFYSEEYLNGSHAYVASLIEKMTADFSYDLDMENNDVKYQYSYKIDAQVEVKDKETQMAIFNPVYELKPETTKIAKGKTLSIYDSVELDYNAYNKLAKDFISAYNLNETESTLIVKMYVSVLGESQSFKDQKNNAVYEVKVCIPLNKKTVTPYTQTSEELENGKILAVDNPEKEIYKKATIYFAIIDIVLIAVLMIYSRATVDKHLDYSRKVKRILSNYKSYIQKINNSVDHEKYEVLNVDTFTELLEIRDTLQNPILMYENHDKTCSEFFIITSSGIMYLYKISVIFEETDFSYDDDEIFA